MKRSRSHSSAERSSTVDDNSSNTETNSSYDSYESEGSSPPPPAPVRAKPEVKVSNRVSSTSSKQKSNTSSTSSSSKSSSSSNHENSQTKRVKHSCKDKNTTQSKCIKVHAADSQKEDEPLKGCKFDHSSKTKVIEIIDSSTSEYSPSDETGSSSSSESESETQSRQPGKPAKKRAKKEIKLDDPNCVPAIKKTKVAIKSTPKKLTSRPKKAEGKECTRFSREEDEAIIAFIDKSIRTVDLMKHLRETFPEQQPRIQTSVRYHRISLFDKWRETILGAKK